MDRSLDTAMLEEAAAADLDDREPAAGAPAADGGGRPGAPDGAESPALAATAPPDAARARQPGLEAAIAEAAIAEAASGSEDAFRLLYRDIQPRVLRYLRSLVSDDAEDVASETWLHVARDLKTFRGDLDAFRGWVATIARNRATDHLRRVSRRPKPAAVTAEELIYFAANDDTAVQALDAVSTDAALGLIGSLPHDQAEAVLLRVVVGLDAKSAGRVLGKRPGAVRTAAYRGLHKLAEQLQQAGARARNDARSAGAARRGGDRRL